MTHVGHSNGLLLCHSLLSTAVFTFLILGDFLNETPSRLASSVLTDKEVAWCCYVTRNSQEMRLYIDG